MPGIVGQDGGEWSLTSQMKVTRLDNELILLNYLPIGQYCSAYEGSQSANDQRSKWWQDWNTFVITLVDFTPQHPSKFEHLMDEHYNYNDASEWTLCINCRIKPTLTQNGPGVQLEEWTNARNTKNRHSKQLRNFLEVSTTKHLTIWMEIDIVQQGQWHQRHLQTDSDRGKWMPETVHGSKERWFWNRGSCSPYPRDHLPTRTPFNTKTIQHVRCAFTYGPICLLTYLTGNLTGDFTCVSQWHWLDFHHPSSTMPLCRRTQLMTCSDY